MKQPEILNTLRDAQLAHEAGDFVNALHFYEYFFDHALDDDPYALYGVRLSYCLDGWAKLAEIFIEAKNRLQQKQQAVLDDYLSTKVIEKFHDYYCISSVLDEQQAALQTFNELHANNPKSAAKLAKYVWDDLVIAENWLMCSTLLEQPEQKLDECFAVYDEAQQLKLADPSFDNAKFDQHLIDTLLNNVSDIVQVLRYNQRSNEIDELQRQFYRALEQRNHASLSKAVHAKASFLFVGH